MAINILKYIMKYNVYSKTRDIYQESIFFLQLIEDLLKLNGTLNHYDH